MYDELCAMRHVLFIPRTKVLPNILWYNPV